MVQKLKICEKVYFDQLLIFQYCFYYSFTLYYCAIFNSLNAESFSIPSGCQTVWIQIRPDILSGLIWVQTVCKGYKQMIKVTASRQRVRYSTFWLKPWLKSISFGSNFFYLAKVLATTNSEPGLALDVLNFCPLSQLNVGYQG